MDNTKLLLEAISFAARAHEGQHRKDGETPYASHVFRVCMVLRHILGVEDEKILAAAVLHDTIEDTTTDFDDIRKKFGPEIASWVGALSKDKRLPEEERELLFYKTLTAAVDAVKLIKIADLYDNNLDSKETLPEKHAKHVDKATKFIKYLQESRMSPVVRDAADKLTALLTNK